MLEQLDCALIRIEHLAHRLRSDPDRYVYRTALELRAAFDGRQAIEPAFARMRASLRMLRRCNEDGSRRDYQRRTRTLDALQAAVEDDVLPRLRQMGFDV